jgi:hypothetical protein
MHAPTSCIGLEAGEAKSKQGYDHVTCEIADVHGCNCRDAASEVGEHTIALVAGNPHFWWRAVWSGALHDSSSPRRQDALLLAGQLTHHSLYTLFFNSLSSTHLFNTQEPIHPDSAHHFSNIGTPR